jgi:hypothetical protein
MRARWRYETSALSIVFAHEDKTPRNQMRRTKMDDNHVTLEEKCFECAGSGSSIAGPCPACHGRRYVPTDFGQAVLNMIHRHFQIEEKDEFDGPGY